ncbi:TPA: helix-turn-helix domain-containing protein, partial [Salmonella enterica subsp. enterica serovar Kodjovi]|nr:helix-turn-helix domain-containing protein [Salmonella enterica subsp. enterica serovar Kodjovi]
MKTFDGFSLKPTDAFSNINLLLEAGMLLAASTNGGTEEIGDIVISIAKKYSYTACQKTTQPAAPTGSPPNNIGYRIQIARESLGMSEDDLAEKLNIHPGDVLTWEDGADQPLAGMVIPLANALKCDPMWLLTGEGNNANQA